MTGTSTTLLLLNLQIDTSRTIKFVAILTSLYQIPSFQLFLKKLSPDKMLIRLWETWKEYWFWFWKINWLKKKS